jgi:hypothetical protein
VGQLKVLAAIFDEPLSSEDFPDLPFFSQLQCFFWIFHQDPQGVLREFTENTDPGTARQDGGKSFWVAAERPAS